MLNVTARRKHGFLSDILGATNSAIGFADVGSGGDLKRPWSLLPSAYFRKFEFEPTQGNSAAVPLCVSNRTGRAPFMVAHDERGSSFHPPSVAFAQRFGLESLFTKKTIEVECTTLDAYFAQRLDAIDAIDVNVEGHDFQVLQGSTRLLSEGNIKLIKVEFETAPVWEGQGWLSDIDPLLRAHGYTLSDIDIDFARPVNVRKCFHRGEPLWGKALYVPNADRWRTALARPGRSAEAIEQEVAKAVALFVAADVPGHAFDVLDHGAAGGHLRKLDAARVKSQIEDVYRWAKLEYGTSAGLRLISRALGLKGADVEA